MGGRRTSFTKVRDTFEVNNIDTDGIFADSLVLYCLFLGALLNVLEQLTYQESWYKSIDPVIYVRATRKLAYLGIVRPQDPPLRYVIPAAIVRYLNLGSTGQYQVLVILAGISCLILTPLLLYALVRLHYQEASSFLTVCSIVGIFWLQIYPQRFSTGHWHYAMVIPLLLLAFCFAVWAVHRTDWQYPLAMASGCCLGIAGTFQLSATGTMILAIATYLSVKRRFRLLAVVGATGIPFLPYLGLMPPLFYWHLDEAARSPVLTRLGFKYLVESPVAFLTLPTTLLYRHDDLASKHRPLLAVVLVLCSLQTVVYVFGMGLTLIGVNTVTYWLVPLILSVVGVKWLHEYERLDVPDISFPEFHHVVAIGLWTLFFVAL